MWRGVTLSGRSHKSLYYVMYNLIGHKNNGVHSTQALLGVVSLFYMSIIFSTLMHTICLSVCLSVCPCSVCVCTQ